MDYVEPVTTQMPRISRALHLRRRTLLLTLASTASLFAPLIGRADYCEDRVQATMEQVLEMRVDAVEGAERDRMHEALMSLCTDAVRSGGGQAAAAGGGAQEGTGGEVEGTTLFGIEFKKADKDSAGNERLRTKR